MDLRFDQAGDSDAPVLACLRTAVARRLTREYGHGHWSGIITEQSVLRTARTGRVIVARSGGEIVGTFTLATKKPWAIDVSFFTQVERPLYLTDMAVDPNVQRQGIGRSLLDEARSQALSWPAQAIRLDAYDAPAGAGGFYAKCGFREVARVVYRNTPLVYFEQLV
jgi:GNAT superfamily N-acetyltransferase